MKVFVTDGDQRPALAIVRSLGRRGIAVVTGDERPVCLASSSRYCSRHVTYPSPERQPEAFEQFLGEFVERERVDVVMPVTDVTTHAVAINQDALRRHAALATPPFDAFELAANKRRLLERAAACGIPIPATMPLDDRTRLDEVAHAVRYPVVIKPIHSRVRSPHGWVRASVHYASSAAHLRQLFDETPGLGACPTLLQERIEGPGIGLFVLFDRGRLVAAFAHQRLREHPPSGGVSVLRESIPLDPRLKDQAVRLLGPLGWHGVAMLEYKRDVRSGTHVLMEVNGRYWGSLQLAVDAGMDFPYLAYRLALGQPMDGTAGYASGVKSRWLLGDLDHLLLRLFKRNRDLNLPESAPSRLAALVAFLKFAEPGLHYEVLRLSDPRPFKYELGRYVKSLCAPRDIPHAPTTENSGRRAIRVCQIATADVWAGVETQLATAASDLVGRPEVELSAVLFNEGRLARALRSRGIPVAVVDESRNGALAILRFLVRFLREQKIDIVHAHGYKESILGSLAAKLAGARVVRTVHGLAEPLRGWPRARMRAYQRLDRAVLRWCGDLVIAVSERMADGLVEAGYPRATMTRIYNGIDLRSVSAARSSDDVRRELGVGHDALLIGAVGRLTAIKGHHYFLRAARLILDREPRARFLVIGSGPLKDELMATAATLGLPCLFPGQRDDIHDLTAALDIFVLPSLDEGTPMSILEAMTLERPIVATAVGGLPEIISDGETGLLVPPRAEQPLADACLMLACDPVRARTLGTHARRVVEEKFSHRANGAALVDAYRRTAAGTVRGRKRGRAYELARTASRLARRQLSHPVETARMLRVRRNPEAILKRLRDARRILIVCHGNIIRSPFASRLVAQTLNGHSRVTIASAGFGAEAGNPAHATAVLLAGARRVSLGNHRAARLTPEAVAASDVIFVMELAHLVEMRRRFQHAAGKTFLLSCLAPETPLEVADPYGGDPPLFDACFDQISRAVRPIARALAGGEPVCR